MKVAVVADIHGNYYAFKRVLSNARNEGAEKLLILGDICGYYYSTDKVLKDLKKWDYEIIRGNHERLLLKLLLGEDSSSVIEKYGHGHKVALETLSLDQLNSICYAPDNLLVQIGKCRIMMCHGSPNDPDQYLYPNTAVEELVKCDVVNVDFVLVGHSHYPFVFKNKFSTLINAGSVGQSRTVGGIASWVMIDTDYKTFEMKETQYSTSKLQRDIDHYDPRNQYLKSVLRRNLHG